ncbi:comE operon protein 2-like [Procambarus clarkii]|uniref:comE operon protein 2-like n=1 Tax=Procambarus clarkii TaxID=6728 RepID=UPI0037443767
MDWATRVAQLSYAKRLQVGAVIVKDDSAVSYGYNGTPSGWDNVCEDVLEDGSLKTKPEVLHAERNAIDKLAKKGNVGGEGAMLFVTHSPCLECAKSIHGAGITHVYYKHNYRSSDGIEFLEKCGIEVIKVDPDDIA